MRCLVSICNKGPAGRFRAPGTFLLDVDLDRAGIRPVRLDHPRSRAELGVTGLARYQDGILLVPQNARQLVRLDARLTVSDVWDVPEVTGGHSIAVSGSKAWVVCARTDSIVEFEPDSGARWYWRANTGGADTLHMNSALWVDDTLYLSAFGPKADPQGPWSSATNGYILDVATGRRIAGPIRHPHTLVDYDGQLYWCESAGMAVCGQSGQRLDVGRGYVRGLVIDAGHVIVGISKGRNMSVSTGRRIVARVFRQTECAILVYRHDTVCLANSPLVAEISLADYGDEIYDILPLGPFEGS
jgi:hypothetical protein